MRMMYPQPRSYGAGSKSTGSASEKHIKLLGAVCPQILLCAHGIPGKITQESPKPLEMLPRVILQSGSFTIHNAKP